MADQFAQDAVGVDNVRNLLRNGGFTALPRRSDPMRFPLGWRAAPVFPYGPDGEEQKGTPGNKDSWYGRTDYYVRDLQAVYEVTETPDEPFLGSWTITGTEAFVDVNPIIGGRKRVSRDGGMLARVGFKGKTRVDIIQNLSGLLNTLRGQPVTLSFSVYSLTGTVAVTGAVIVDGVGVTKEVSTSAVADRLRTRLTTRIAPGASTVEVRFILEGFNGAQVGLAGVTLALGAYDKPLPYGDNPVDRVLPPGTVVMFAGDACPPGYRRIKDAEGAIPVAAQASPNTVGKVLEEKPSVTASFPGVGLEPINPTATTHGNVGTTGHSHRYDGELGQTPEDDDAERFEVTDPRNPPVMRIDGESTADPDGLDVTITGAGFVLRRWDPRPLPPGVPVPPKLSGTPDDIYIPVLSRGHKHVVNVAGDTMPPYFDLLFCEKI